MQTRTYTVTLMNRLAPALLLLGLVDLLSHFTAGKVETQAGQPIHQFIQDQLDTLQTTVDGIETKVNDVQTTIDNIPPAWGQTLPAAEMCCRPPTGRLLPAPAIPATRGA